MSVFLLSVLKKKNKKCCLLTYDDRQWVEEPRMALIPDVGDEAVSTEVQATSLMMKNLCRSRNKIHRDGERER